MTPGVHPNGLFWTAEIPRSSFSFNNKGTQARLRLRGQPLVDSIAFGEPIGLSARADIDISWRATAPAVERGFGTSVPPEDPGAFEASFADALATGTAKAERIGFSFQTNRMDSSGFFAEIGREANGAFLTDD